MAIKIIMTETVMYEADCSRSEVLEFLAESGRIQAMGPAVLEMSDQDLTSLLSVELETGSSFLVTEAVTRRLEATGDIINSVFRLGCDTP